MVFLQKNRIFETLRKGKSLNNISYEGAGFGEYSLFLGLCRILRKETLIDLSQAFGMSGYSPAHNAVARVKRTWSKTRNYNKKLSKLKQTCLPRKVKVRLDQTPLFDPFVTFVQ
jgi:hypothetical protein